MWIGLAAACSSLSEDTPSASASSKASSFFATPEWAKASPGTAANAPLIRDVSPNELASQDGQVQARNQAEDDNPGTENVAVAGVSHSQPPAFNLDFDGDPGLWAEVLDSIGIDMDRQWVESALLAGQQRRE